MPGGRRSDSLAFWTVVALIALVGYLIFIGSGGAVPETVGTVLATSVIGWSFYRVESIN